MKKIIKGISVALALVMLIQVLPMSAFAKSLSKNDSAAKTTQSQKIDFSKDINSKPKETTPEITDEDTSLRSEFVKQFRRTDGSFTAVEYQDPVHYLKDGKWEDIDNTLVESTGENGEKVYKNKASNLNVEIPEVLTNNNSIKISNNNHEVSFGLDSNNVTTQKTNSQANILEACETAAEANKKSNYEKKTGLENKSSEATYYNVQKDTSLDYDVTSSGLKESIIVTEKQSKYEYNFNLKTNGLKAKVKKDNSISIYDPKTSKEAFVIEEPYMSDSNDAKSDDIKLSLKETKDGYSLTIKPSESWLNSADRAYPVKIDPSIQLPLAYSDIHETYVSTEMPNHCYNAGQFLYVGNNKYAKERTYIRFNLPKIPDCSIVIGSTLALAQIESDPTTPAKMCVYDAGTTSWAPNTITWNNQPTGWMSSSVSDYTAYSTRNEAGWKYWNITDITKKWYEQGVNNGLVIKSTREDATVKARFYASECKIASVYPKVSVSYVNNTGLEDYWTYHSLANNKAGTTYLNDYNGNVVHVHNDISMTGNRLPISISHVYNSNYDHCPGSYDNMRIGVGFSLNIFERVLSSSVAGYPYLYLDGDGTVHYFASTSNANVFKYECNDKIVLTKSNGTLVLTDDKGNRKTFSQYGWILKNEDSNGNAQTFSYGNGRMTGVTDSTGRHVSLNYDSNNYLTSITDPSGRSISFGYGNGFLKTITYSDGKVTHIYYTSDDKLYDVISPDNKMTELSYKTVTTPNGTYHRVSTATLFGATYPRDIENKATYSYGTGETYITDAHGKTKTVMFDDAGRTVCTRDYSGRAVFKNYNSDGNKANTLNYESTTQESVSNLARDHSAELNYGSFYRYTPAEKGTGSVSVASNEHFMGAKSYRVDSTSSTGRVGYEEDVNGTAGKTYTMSAYIKVPQAMATTTGGAFIAISYEDKNGGWHLTEGEHVRSQPEWGRYTLTFTLPSDANGVIGMILCVGYTVGTAYFDCIQLEEGKVANTYNALENSSFDNVRNGQPVGWGGTNLSSSTDKSVTGKRNSGFQITGNPDLNKDVRQTVSMNGKKGDTLVYGGWSRANSVNINHSIDGWSTKYFCVDLIVTYKKSDGTTYDRYYPYDYEAKCPSWQYSSNSVVAEGDYTNATMLVVYNKEMNTCVVDDLELHVDNYGTKYTYDDNGRLIQSQTALNEGVKYNYTGPDLTCTEIVKDGKGNGKEEYTYDDKKNIKTITSKSPNGTDANGNTIYKIDTITDYTYDAKSGGVPSTIKVHSADGSLSSQTSFTYTPYYNYTKTVTDSRGFVTTYNYDTNKGTLNSVQDALGNVVTYTYDPNTDELLSTSGKVNQDIAASITNNYTYTNGLLTKITHNGSDYGFTYDQFGRAKEAKVGNQILIARTYNSSGTVAKSTYGNGDHTDYSYDIDDRLTSESDNGTLEYDYAYTSKDQVGRSADYENGKVYTYDYDLAGRVREERCDDSSKIKITYDDDGNANSVTAEKNYGILSQAKYTYGSENRLDKTDFPMMANGSLTHSYDNINRESGTIHQLTSGGNYKWLTTNKYVDGANKNVTSLVSDIMFQKDDTNSGSEVKTGRGNISYTYDKLSNIDTISKNNGAINIKYYYDGLNQLVREDNAELDKTITYAYDNGGNITSKSEYAYTTGTLGAVQKTTPYAYGDTNWKDKLTSYNGNAITYDAIGNPLTYSGYAYTWQKGRQLKAIDRTSTGLHMSFKYNSDGMRTQKTVNGVSTDYIYAGNMLMSQQSGTNKLNFVYDGDGTLFGIQQVSKDNTGKDVKSNYYYMFDAQGTIIGLYNAVGDIVAKYTYDSWGKMAAVTDGSGNAISDSSNIANLNPYRYRGYYYDTETGLYYLQSRYYNPEMGRFMNADTTDVLSASKDVINDNNLFSYCCNNPVMNTDSSGSFNQRGRRITKKRLTERQTKWLENALDYGGGCCWCTRFCSWTCNGYGRIRNFNVAIWS